MYRGIHGDIWGYMGIYRDIHKHIYGDKGGIQREIEG